MNEPWKYQAKLKKPDTEPYIVLEIFKIGMSTGTECWALKNWCFWIVVLEKTLESPLDSREIKSGNPKGNPPWIFIRRTDTEAEAPILWPPDVKNWLTGKDLDARKHWRHEEKATTVYKKIGWHHWLDGHEFEQARGLVMAREAWCAGVHWVPKSWTWLTELTIVKLCKRIQDKDQKALLWIS